MLYMQFLFIRVNWSLALCRFFKHNITTLKTLLESCDEGVVCPACPATNVSFVSLQLRSVLHQLIVCIGSHNKDVILF